MRGSYRLKAWLDGDPSRVVLDRTVLDSWDGTRANNCKSRIDAAQLAELLQGGHGSFNTLIGKPGHRCGDDAKRLAEAFNNSVRQTCEEEVQTASKGTSVRVAPGEPIELNPSLWGVGEHVVAIEVTPTQYDASGVWFFRGDLLAVDTKNRLLVSFDRTPASTGFALTKPLEPFLIRFKVANGRK